MHVSMVYSVAVLVSENTILPCVSLTTSVVTTPVADIPLVQPLNINVCSVVMPTTLLLLSPVDRQALLLILPKIVTPYHADTFEHELISLNLFHNFLFLADRI
jgi:hypothetical protein